jgi:hypothetical protein
MTNASLLRLRDDVNLASELIAPSWPLSSVIAVNPLSGFEGLAFDEALGRAEALFGSRGVLTPAEYRAALASGRIEAAALEAALDAASERHPGIDRHDLLAEVDDVPPLRTARTIAERHDDQHGTHLRRTIDIEVSDWCAQWATRPARGDFWTDWRAEDPEGEATLPADVDAALMASLEQLRVPHYAQREYLARHLAALPGWSAHLRWRQDHDGGDILIGFLATTTTIEARLVAGTAWFTDDGPPPRRPSTAIDPRPLIWQDAYERTVHDRLLRTIDDAPAPSGRAPVDAQVVCCIDVRSEGLRRNLERIGAYETFGYAGFFGLAAHVVPVTGRGGTDQCPVLLTPSVTVTEHGPDGALRTAAALDDAWHAAKHHPIAPLALAEGSGWAAGPLAALRTAAPALAARVADALPHHRGDATPSTFDRRRIDPDAQAAVVAAILRLGIGTAPAPLVVLCGHDARIDNNPMESALACGACGGHGGGANARIVAAMANDPDVRARLARLGHPISDTTWFVAAEHDTPTDHVELLDEHLVPDSHRLTFAALRADLGQAGAAAALDRASALPGRPRSLQAVRRRSRDWAEPVAELGLAGNMAFVIGPRHLTAHADLGRRVFLHSYDAASDPDGSVLGGILTAPLIVAQWINAQYYFSTTDPETFGAGSKAVHNVLGDIGVLSAAGGDLRRGLPLQSVRAGSRLLHEPVRLLAIVEGARDHIDTAMASSPTLDRLVANQWIRLLARTGPGSPWQHRTPDGWNPHQTLPKAALDARHWPQTA